MAVLAYQWEGWTARPKQCEPPGDWTYWLILAGRGFGKTRIGAEWVRGRATSDRFQYVNLIAATADDARDIMIEGESGILAICPEWERPEYRSSKRRLEWPNGCTSLIFTADEPERLRGKQHESLWADEVASWRYPESWDQAMFGLRIGPDPKAVVTTTPRPTQLIKDLGSNPATAVTVGTTYENRDNLAPEFYRTVISKYEGTRLGRQELNAEILDDVPGALWTRATIDKFRVPKAPYAFSAVVVGVDPQAVADEETGSADTGIVVAAHSVTDMRGYVLADNTISASPEQWALAAINAYRFWEADVIVAEKNNGGDMVRATIHAVDPNVPVKLVWASRGKRTRAEPVSALYEQGRISHVGAFPELEDQMCGWVPDMGMDSPDRMDALVWAFTELMISGGVGKHYSSIEPLEEQVERRGGLTLRGKQIDPKPKDREFVGTYSSA